MSARTIIGIVVILAGISIAVAYFMLRNTGELAGYSNILAADYVGPEACQKCHEEKYDLWSSHAHSVMNQIPTEESVTSDFSGTSIDYAGGTVTFETRDGDYLMTLRRDGKLVRQYKVTRTVGSKFIQFFIGLQVKGPEPYSHDLYSIDHKLAFGFLKRRNQWLPATYFDPGPSEYIEDGSLRVDPYDDPDVHSWATSCFRCHNTYPYVDRILYRNQYTGFPHQDLRKIEKFLLIAGREIGPSLELGAPQRAVTVGISCESCHFGGREHVENKKPMIFAPTHPGLEIVRKGRYGEFKPSRKDPYVVNSICSQCHSATVTRYPNETAIPNSREALDISNGACASEIRCTHCHNPHKPGPMEDGPPNPEHIRACLRCHGEFEDAESLENHTQHSVTAEVSCLDCHMPYISMGLERIIRSHNISLPNDWSMLETASPNACSVCHLDRSIDWVLDGLRKGWKKEIEPTQAMIEAYGGSLDRPVGEVWLHNPDADLRKVATQSYGRSPIGLGDKALPNLVRALDDAHPSNRLYTLMAIERITGQQLTDEEFNVLSVGDEREHQVQALVRSLELGKLVLESQPQPREPVLQ